MFGLQHRGELPGVVENEFENFMSRLRKLWLVEHNEDGTHITSSGSAAASSVTIAGLSVLGRSSSTAGAGEDITASADGQVLRRSGSSLAFGTLATTGITNNAVTHAKLADIATLSVIGRSTAGTGDPETLTAGTDNQVLRRSGTALAFGAVNIASSDAITGNLPYANLPSGSGTWTANPTISGTLNVSGVATLGGNAYPTVTGSNNQVLTTNGSGTLSWTAKEGSGSGGISSLNSQTGATQTFSNDTNVTVTSSGDNHALGWTGQLALTRGGTAANLTAAHGGLVYSTASALAITAAGVNGQIIKSTGAGAPTWNTPAALTKADDTNITLTLGGSPSNALVNAASLTLGWTGQLSVSRGGTGRSSVTAGTIPYGNGTSALNITNVKFVTPGTNTFSAAAAAMSNGDVLWLDQGTYTQTETVTIPAGVIDFAIIGQGQGVTVINYTTNDVDGITSGGIGVSDSNRVLRALITGFSMYYRVGAAASTKTGITLWGHTYETQEHVNIRIVNVSISYKNGDVGNCWITAIRIINARVVVLDNIFIRRDPSGRTGTGILMESCQQCRIINSLIMSTGIAIDLIKAADALIADPVTKHGCEDITVSNNSCYIYGTGVHLGYKAYACKILGNEFPRPSNVAIHDDNTLGGENGGYHMIDNAYVDIDGAMVGTSLIYISRPGTFIRGCQLNFAADMNINGIIIDSGGSLSAVIGNLFRGAGGNLGAQGVWVIANACQVCNNTFENSTTLGNDILLSGNNNLVLGNMIDDAITDSGAGNTVSTNPVH